MGRATAKAPIEAPAVLNAPLFRLLIDQLDSSGRRVILDLGAASTPLLALLGRSRCRVEIADVASDGGIGRVNTDAPADDRVRTAESLLPGHLPGGAVDLVFCWDLLNYLKPEAISALMNAIAARARPGTLVHALVVYSERSMPDRPGRFVPTEDLKLVNRVAPAAVIEAPRYSPEFLGRIMNGFVIDHARLLANGMQEFLFRLEFRT
ncbi:MAG TPA: hypothetical protein VMO24_09410 [Woeseiaceae bacterium]|jgi:hypothetical protein|nr:hypothetical protein [Woeseiaceae bacterium]